MKRPLTVTQHIQKARTEFVETKITLRNARRAHDEETVAFTALQDYKAGGTNEAMRKQALAEKIRVSPALVKLRRIRDEAEDETDRAEARLENWREERNAGRDMTWAIHANYLRGRVDHVSHAPEQAVGELAKEAMIEEIFPEDVSEDVSGDDAFDAHSTAPSTELPF